jgi:hypothetical protein
MCPDGNYIELFVGHGLKMVDGRWYVVDGGWWREIATNGRGFTKK